MSQMVAEQAVAEFARLHITPFNAELLKAYLGSTLAPLAKDISFHNVQTFPEKGFGYITLPAMEAAKIKKKLNGSMLKGQKIRIEDAKPEKRKRSTEDDAQDGDEGDATKKKTRRSKKIKASLGVVPGHELEDGRKVKRGWTETPAEKQRDKQDKKKSRSKEEKAARKEKKEQKKREASKYTTEPECLFRTTLPAASSKKAEGDGETKDKKKKSKGREVVVHEFAKTKKHASFLRSSNAMTDQVQTQEYVEGKGWVNVDGELVEEESEKQRARREKKERKATKKAAEDAEAEQRKRDAEQRAREKAEQVAKEADGDDSSSSSEDPSDESSVDSSDGEGSADDGEEEPVPHTEPVEKEVHPLEALYKRPKLSSLDTTPKTSKQPDFSFFGAEDDSDLEEESDGNGKATEPQTPFTKQDMEWRGLRSAAPTPDTAAIGLRFSFSAMNHINEDEEDEEEVEVVNGSRAVNGLGITEDVDMVEEQPSKASKPQKEESEFAKWFYEHRSENNKTWRARRREAMKAKRKRENRRLTRRIV